MLQIGRVLGNKPASAPTGGWCPDTAAAIVGEDPASVAPASPGKGADSECIKGETITEERNQEMEGGNVMGLGGGGCYQ